MQDLTPKSLNATSSLLTRRGLGGLMALTKATNSSIGKGVPTISDSPDGEARRKAKRPSARLDMEYSELPLRVLRRSTAALALVDRMTNKPRELLLRKRTQEFGVARDY